MYTIQLSKLRISDSNIAGGKAASLGEMTKAGITVPSGYIVLIDAFIEFLEANKINNEIEKILSGVNVNNPKILADASGKIINLINKSSIPKNIEKEIIDNFRKIKSKYVAVRSSATAEDSLDASWAGELETYLNVDKTNLINSIKKCWSSLFSPRAIYYRANKKLLKKKVSVAVVVQKMIDSEISGITFTVDPVSQDYNLMVIEAGHGLGEAIVGGIITPDKYSLRKSKAKSQKATANFKCGYRFEIVDRKISNQKIKIIRKENRTVEVPVSKIKQNSQKLNDEQIVKIAEICQQIENHYKFPQDIEWAFSKGKFYITQSRPITTLDRKLNKKEKESKLLSYLKSQEWFSGVRADESLLFYSAKQVGYKKYLKKEHGIEFAETLLIPIKKDYPVRVFNLEQAKAFHEVSRKKVLKNPSILADYVKKNDLVWERINNECVKLLELTDNGNFKQSLSEFIKIIKLYEVASAQFIIIFSMGWKLTENKHQIENINKILVLHDKWRNSVAFEEEKMGEAIYYFLRLIISKKKLSCEPKLLMKYITWNELKKWINGEISGNKIINSAQNRKKVGSIYADIKGDQIVVENKNEIEAIRNFFISKINKEEEIKSKNFIKGDVAFSSKPIKGQVIVIKDKNQLKNFKKSLRNKVLVAIQTTPHFIPYLSGVRAIITDEGGLTCHAAIVSREMKIPCIVGTGNATKLLKNNNLVEVDTIGGTVKKLKIQNQKYN